MEERRSLEKDKIFSSWERMPSRGWRASFIIYFAKARSTLKKESPKKRFIVMTEAGIVLMITQINLKTSMDPPLNAREKWAFQQQKRIRCVRLSGLFVEFITPGLNGICAFAPHRNTDSMIRGIEQVLQKLVWPVFAIKRFCLFAINEKSFLKI